MTPRQQKIVNAATHLVFFRRLRAATKKARDHAKADGDQIKSHVFTAAHQDAVKKVRKYTQHLECAVIPIPTHGRSGEPPPSILEVPQPSCTAPEPGISQESSSHIQNHVPDEDDTSLKNCHGSDSAGTPASSPSIPPHQPDPQPASSPDPIPHV